MSTTGLDHVGVAVPDLDTAAAEWQALGFTVQPLAPHTSGGKPTGTNVQRVPTGTGNRNIMLRQGYIELLATIDPARPSATIARFLAHHPGIHVLTLATDDEEDALARLTRANFSAAITHSSRPADPADPHGPQAEFARIALTDADPRLQLLRHRTPDLVWQPRFLTHPNRARALREVIIAADAVFAARLARAAGLPIHPDPAGGYALRLPGQQTIRILLPESATRLLPGATIPSLPAILGLVIQTEGTPAPTIGHASGVTILFTA